MLQQGRINPFRPLSSLRRFDRGFTCVQLVPTFPSIDFSWDYLLSFCVYGLLETPRLPVTPRPYGNRRSVLAWSDTTSFRIQTLDLCDLVSH
jgi:hypothetical protein